VVLAIETSHVAKGLLLRYGLIFFTM